MVLEINNLTKKYSNNRGTFNITFNIDEGEIFGLLGPNGSGKTTLLKMITGLTSCQSGYIKIFGYDLSDDRANALKKVGALIEAPASIPYISAYNNLKLVKDFYEDPLDVDNTLETVGLLKVKNDIISKYSLGMKQRLGIALSIIGNPKLLVLDEPSNGLDIEATIAIRDMLINFCKCQNTTLLISSHLAHEIEVMCTKVGIMEDGKLIDITSMEHILENNKSLEDYYLRVVKNYRTGEPNAD